MEMMDLIKEAVNSFGFPIVMVGYFIFDKYKTTQPMITAINNVTIWMQILSQKLDIESCDLIEKK